jgi:uncharacterized membrane protein (DUF2068 family)
MAAVQQQPALRLIIAYKLVRASVALVAGITLLTLLVTRFDDAIRQALSGLEERAMNALTEGFSAGALWAVEPDHILGLGALLTLDGLITFVEGWALLRGWRWGVWLVVAASSLLIPFELASLVEKITILRTLALVINVTIVGWLVRQRWLAYARRVTHM